MKLGIVYAGQGSQRVGMGQDFYEKYDLFKETIDKATESVKPVTDMDVAKLSFEGPMEQLSETRYTQPAMVAFAIGVTKLLHKKEILEELNIYIKPEERKIYYVANKDRVGSVDL